MAVFVCQSEVSTMGPQVAFFEHRRAVLNVDNNSIKQKMATLLQNQLFQDGKFINKQAPYIFLLRL